MEVNMRKQQYDLPTMYADHHVLEVRQMLLAIPGVMDVYASSAFQFVEVTFDESQTNDLQISMVLDEAGYLGEWTAPIEVGAIANPSEEKGNGVPKAYFRHTEAYETTRKAGKSVVSFSQNVSSATLSSGRPLWPCPGLGTLSTKRKLSEED
jgi:copper chaperone CopZ